MAEDTATVNLHLALAGLNGPHRIHNEDGVPSNHPGFEAKKCIQCQAIFLHAKGAGEQRLCGGHTCLP